MNRPITVLDMLLMAERAPGSAASLLDWQPTPDQADRNEPKYDKPRARTRTVPWRGKRGGGRGLDPHNYKRWDDRPTNS